MPNTDLTLTDQARIVHECIVAIASHCDGALTQDKVGFNGSDTKFGRRVAAIPFEEWTPDIIQECSRILGNTYRVQAQTWTGWDVRDLSIVREAAEVYTTNHAARNQARAAEQKRTAASKRVITIASSYDAPVPTLVFTFPFDREILTALKASSVDFKFSSRDKTWRIPSASVNKDVINVATTYGFRYNTDVDKLLEAGAEVEAPIVHTGTVVLEDAHLFISLTGRLGGDSFRQYRNLRGYRWIRGGNDSIADVTESNLAWLAANGFDVAEGILETFKSAHAAFAARQATEAKAAQERLASSRAAESDLDLSAVTPDGLAPYGFQVAGVEYALKTRRTFIADEMGLGKTVQAILAVEASGSHPVVVVCPASLKGNWAKEIARWAPNATTTTLSGRTPTHGAVRNIDYIICNYDILAGWINELITLAPQALIVDESHYAKNPTAKRTKALLALSQAVPQSGLVLLLTGTPILNRPVELITQLKILGKLEQVAPTPSKGRTDAKSIEFAFKFRYCGPENNGYGWLFQNSSNEAELNEKLRRSCLIRRERSAVLDLKDTVRTQVSLTLNGALKDYRLAEKDAIAFIRSELGSEAARRANRAETLVKLNLLRRLAEEAKIAATIEWVNDWLESYPTKKLVIFSGHVSVQKALVAEFDCPHILGGEKDAEGQKAAFQEGDARVIVCSLQAAREGHTLTAASDVVFTSLGWTPGGLQQAEDRCNRIGQEADKVVAWQLHAEDTIDETIGALIDRKRQVFNAVVRGDGSDVDESILDGVIDYLESKGA